MGGYWGDGDGVGEWAIDVVVWGMVWHVGMKGVAVFWPSFMNDPLHHWARTYPIFRCK